MSLINDALKRASQSDRNRPRPVETHASLEPVSHRRGRTFPILLGTGVVLTLGLAGWFFGEWWSASHPPSPIKEETAVVSQHKPTPAPVPAKHEAVPPPASIPPAPPVVAVTPAPAPAPEPEPPPPAKPVVEAWPVELKLMGIFFNKINPRALINGKTVVVGDEIEGISVTQIERDHVMVEWNGKAKTLLIE